MNGIKKESQIKKCVFLKCGMWVSELVVFFISCIIMLPKVIDFFEI